MEYLIIGAGISGLYLGYILNKLNVKFKIIEKNNYIGGRILTEKWHGININIGAGVFKEDHINLINLLNELDIKYKSHKGEYKFIYNKNQEDIDLNLIYQLTLPIHY